MILKKFLLSASLLAFISGCENSSLPSLPDISMPDSIPGFGQESSEVRLQSNKPDTQYCIDGVPLSLSPYSVERNSSLARTIKNPPTQSAQIFAVTPGYHYWKDDLNDQSTVLSFHFSESNRGCKNGLCVTQGSMIGSSFGNLCAQLNSQF